MGSNWQTVKLKDIVNFNTGKLNSNAAVDGGQYPFFTCSPETLRINTHAFDCEAVLLAGNNANGVFPVKYYDGRFNAYQRTYVITPKANIELDVKWLFFQIQHVTKVLQNLSVGTATKFLTKQILDSFEVKLPPFEHQKKISNHLWSLLEKENLNRQINQTLEQMAQTLFKSWFVDFDPVIDNALDAGFFEQELDLPDGLLLRAEVRRAVRERGDFKPLPEATRQLFPAAFEECAEPSVGLGGWVPQGWTTCSTSDFGTIVCGKTPSKKIEEFYGRDVQFIKIPDMHGNVFLTKTEDGLTTTGSDSQIKKLLPANSICISCIATVGLVSITTKPAHTNQQINSVIPKADYFRDYLYFSFLDKNKLFHDLASGGSTTLNMNTGVFSKVKFMLPQKNVLSEFQRESGIYLERIKQAMYEIETLSSLRDTLLPKLISGELRLDNIEADLAKVEVA